MGPDTPLWCERLGVLIDRGVAIIVATCDEFGVPGLTRGWGASFVDPDEVVLAVTARTGTPSAAHLVPGAPLSITVSEMTTYTTVQLLGDVIDIGPIDDDAQQRVDVHLERFADEAARLGVKADATNLFLGDLVLVRLRVSRATEQTPGERAGKPLETW